MLSAIYSSPTFFSPWNTKQHRIESHLTLFSRPKLLQLPFRTPKNLSISLLSSRFKILASLNLLITTFEQSRNPMLFTSHHPHARLLNWTLCRLRCWENSNSPTIYGGFPLRTHIRSTIGYSIHSINTALLFSRSNFHYLPWIQIFSSC